MTFGVEASTGRILEKNLDPGSREWQKRMSASKVSAIMGHSSYDSRFSMWFKMAGIVAPEAQTDIQARGHYLEPAIAHWWIDRHPEYQAYKTRTWVHTERAWQTADPDRMLSPAGDTLTLPTAALEIKSAAELDSWGEEFTDEIPVGYDDQCQWQMDTIGHRVTHVAVLLPYLQFKEYVVHYNPEKARMLRQVAKDFLDTLPGGPNEQRPEIDGHSETYVAVRKLHPMIDPFKFEVPDDLAARYLDLTAAEKASKEARQQVTSELADLMGTAQKAVTKDGAVIASRVPGRTPEAPPSLRAAPVSKKRTTTREDTAAA